MVPGGQPTLSYWSLPGKATCGLGNDFSHLECSLALLPLANSFSLQCGPGHHLEKVSLVPGDWAAYLTLPLPQRSQHNDDFSCVLNCLSPLRVLSTLPIGWNNGGEVVSPGRGSLNRGMTGPRFRGQEACLWHSLQAHVLFPTLLMVKRGETTSYL